MMLQVTESRDEDLIMQNALHNIDGYKIIKASKGFGYVIGGIGSLIVIPYAYSFGKDVAIKILHINGSAGPLAIGVYFAVTGTVGIVAVSSFFCSSIYPEISSSMMASPLDEIRSRSKVGKLVKGLRLTKSVLLGLISTSPGAYLTYDAFQEYIKDFAIIFGVANLVAWSTVSAWGLYAMPQKAYWYMIENIPRLSCSAVDIERVKLLTELDKTIGIMKALPLSSLQILENDLFNNAVSPEAALITLLDRNHQLMQTGSSAPAARFSVVKAIGVVGVLAGIGSVYFYIPAGAATGKLVAHIIHQESLANVFAPIISISSFTCQALLTAFAAKTCFESTYTAISTLVTCKPKSVAELSANSSRMVSVAEEDPLLAKNLPVDQQDRQDAKVCNVKENIILALIIVLAFSASAHRTEITAKYVPANFFGTMVIGLSVLGLFCMNYWAISGLTRNIEGMREKNLARTEFFSKMNKIRSSFEVIEDRAITSIYNKTGLAQ